MDAVNSAIPARTHSTGLSRARGGLGVRCVLFSLRPASARVLLLCVTLQ